jgi:hypothetical protein
MLSPLSAHLSHSPTDTPSPEAATHSRWPKRRLFPQKRTVELYVVEQIDGI